MAIKDALHELASLYEKTLNRESEGSVSGKLWCKIPLLTEAIESWLLSWTGKEFLARSVTIIGGQEPPYSGEFVLVVEAIAVIDREFRLRFECKLDCERIFLSVRKSGSDIDSDLIRLVSRINSAPAASAAGVELDAFLENTG